MSNVELDDTTITPILRRLAVEGQDGFAKFAPTRQREIDMLRTDNRVEEIARLLVTLPFGDMLELALDVSTAPLETETTSGKELPPDIQLAIRLNTWARKRMEERNGSVRPKTEAR